MARGAILVVDDEPSILSTLKKALSLEGYAVDVAGGIRLAEERLAKKTYDVMLLNVALPDGDGLDLLAKLREGGTDVAVIMMSGHATIDAAVRATRLGALDFLEKPLSTDRLLVMLENAFRLLRAEEEARELKTLAGHFEELVGSSAPMVELRERVLRAARSNASVLVTGERGTGKELVARAIHRASPRAKAALERLNCAAVPAELIESELFGHEAGAFTGATKQRAGKFERAHGGTIFLDEVGDMPLAMQAKLLRVLQEREIERVGGHEVIKVDVRVVAATNRDLLAACEKGEFRADLYDRLNVVPLEIPPLRARRDDIPVLARRFLDLARVANARPSITLTDDAVAAMVRHPFPGQRARAQEPRRTARDLEPRRHHHRSRRRKRARPRRKPSSRRPLPSRRAFQGARRRRGALHHRGSARPPRAADDGHRARPRPRTKSPVQEGESVGPPR